MDWINWKIAAENKNIIMNYETPKTSNIFSIRQLVFMGILKGVQVRAAKPRLKVKT